MLREVLPAVLPVLAVSLIVALAAVRRGMAPVKAVAEALVGLDPARSKVKLERDAVPSEIVPLVDAVNASLERVREAFEHERRFLADAAHELRTPIAVLRARVDGLDDRATAARLAADVDRLGHIVGRLLTRARIEQDKARWRRSTSSRWRATSSPNAHRWPLRRGAISNCRQHSPGH
ncbi:hypothetical protein D3874_01560 [Oleomonas cavernae]|uniref:histidine kinase n=1 Tax=Oleomonas cavernae TaxID=2320859 RepID=A0A418WTF3_9PROT|nr:histidine kinase dimerization/phospho-acceptor domain-containing protein [Oleomonas cavernae]RJF94551.1 hypothetical protein D3874_01560 [Oleomonas cavernae]